jgi:hypothetical protein
VIDVLRGNVEEIAKFYLEHLKGEVQAGKSVPIGFLLGSLFDSEDIGETSVDFHRTTQKTELFIVTAVSVQLLLTWPCRGVILHITRLGFYFSVRVVSLQLPVGAIGTTKYLL